MSIGGPFDTGYQEASFASNDAIGRPERTIDASSVRAEVAWFRIHEDPPNWKAVESNWISRDRSLFYAELMARWQGQDLKSTLDNTLRQLEKMSKPRSHAVVFWTQSVPLNVDRSRRERNPTATAVRDGAGSHLGPVNLMNKWREERPDQLPFILISRNLRWKESFLDLRCVEWVGEVAFRVQVVRDATITDSLVYSGFGVETCYSCLKPRL